MREPGKYFESVPAYVCMDSTKQLYESDAEGWRRGVYLDIKDTFRAPIINWIFRSLMANEPEFTRYLWGQVKPVFLTKEFASFTIEYRDGILSAIEKHNKLPKYRRGELDSSPAEFHELREQICTFDTVAPRLALFFEIVYRGLQDELVRSSSNESVASTAPFSTQFEEPTGAPPTMMDSANISDSLTETIRAIQTFHGLEGGIPSIYRCLAQWPTALSTLWDDLEPIFTASGFDDANDTSTALVADFTDNLGYSPSIKPKALTAHGFERSKICELQSFIEEFYYGPADTVLLTLPVYAAVLNAGGPRSFP